MPARYATEIKIRLRVVHPANCEVTWSSPDDWWVSVKWGADIDEAEVYSHNTGLDLDHESSLLSAMFSLGRISTKWDDDDMRLWGRKADGILMASVNTSTQDLTLDKNDPKRYSLYASAEMPIDDLTDLVDRDLHAFD